jgi:hypothetical protein
MTCFMGIHHKYYIKWVKCNEGALGYWYCPDCFTTFHGVIHRANQDGSPSAYQIRELDKKEVRKFLHENVSCSLSQVKGILK